MANPANITQLVSPITQFSQVPSTSDVRAGSGISYRNRLDTFNLWSEREVDTSVYEAKQFIQNPREKSFTKVSSKSVTVNIQQAANPAPPVPTAVQIYEEWEGKMVFEFNLMGYTKLRDLIFTYAADMQALMMPQNPYVQNAFENVDPLQIEAPLNKQKIFNIPQPEFAFTDFLSRVQVRVGTNSLNFEEQNMEDWVHRKVIAQSLNMDPREAARTAHLGLRSAKGNCTSESGQKVSNVVEYGSPAADTVYFGMDLGQLKMPQPEKECSPQEWTESHFQRDTLYAPVPCVESDGTVGAWLNNNFLVTVPTQRTYNLPLYMFVPFFNQEEVYLPTQTPIRLEFYFRFFQKSASENAIGPEEWIGAWNAWNQQTADFRNSFPTVMRPASQTDVDALRVAILQRPMMLGDGLTVKVLPGFTQNLLQNAFLTYTYYLPAQNTQDRINKLWSLSPFVYEYDSWIKFPIDQQYINNMYVLNFNVVQNWNRPSIMYFRPRLIKADSNVRTAALYTNNTFQDWKLNHMNAWRGYINQNVVTPIAAEQLGWANDAWGLPTAANPISYLSGTALFPGSTASSTNPFAVKNFQLLSGGDLLVDYQNKTLAWNDPYSFREDALNSSLKKMNRQIGEEASADSLVWDENLCAYKLTLTPSRYVEPHHVPLDRGPVVLKLQITLLSPYPANFFFDAYGVCAEQMQMSNTYSCSVLKWPVSLVNNSEFKQITLNTN